MKMKIFENYYSPHSNPKEILENKANNYHNPWGTVDVISNSKKERNSEKRISIIAPKFYVSGLNVNSCRKMHINLETENKDYSKLNIFYNKKLISSNSLSYKNRINNVAYAKIRQERYSTTSALDNKIKNRFFEHQKDLQSRNQILESKIIDYERKTMDEKKERKSIFSFPKYSAKHIKFKQNKIKYNLYNNNEDEKEIISFKINPFLGHQSSNLIKKVGNILNEARSKEENILSKPELFEIAKNEIIKEIIPKLSIKYAENKAFLTQILNREIGRHSDNTKLNFRMNFKPIINKKKLLVQLKSKEGNESHTLTTSARSNLKLN